MHIFRLAGMVGHGRQIREAVKTWAAILFAGACFGSGSGPCLAQDLPIRLDAARVPLVKDLGYGSRIGRLRFHGMLALPTLKVNGLRFSQFSGLAWDEDDDLLYAITDKGALFHLQPILATGNLIGLKLVKAVPLRELKTGEPLKHRRTDAEGLDIHNGRNGHRGDAELIVSFERQPRIVRYRPDGHALREHSLPIPLRDNDVYRSGNKALESICEDDRYGLITVPETPLRNDPPDNVRIISFTGHAWSYPLSKGSRIVALECMGKGRLLVLERALPRFYDRGTVSLKRTTLTDTGGPYKPLQVDTLISLDAAKGHEIDNFEGLARHRGNHFFLISDDNDLFVQRSLLLYFELLEE
jgi:hypothetical protein